MAELWPGEFGWKRSFGEGSGPAIGAVLCLLLPSATSRKEVGMAPLPGVDRAEYSHLEVISGPPWRILAARLNPKASPGGLASFAEAVARELREE